jgi:hypothetical protein
MTLFVFEKDNDLWLGYGFSLRSFLSFERELSDEEYEQVKTKIRRESEKKAAEAKKRLEAFLINHPSD